MLNYDDMCVAGGVSVADDHFRLRHERHSEARRRRELSGPHYPAEEVACTCRDCGAVTMVDKAQVDYQARRGYEYACCYVCAKHSDRGRWDLTIEARAAAEAEQAKRKAEWEKERAAERAAYKAQLDAFYKRAKFVSR